jgi:hypothetical protein
MQLLNRPNLRDRGHLPLYRKGIGDDSDKKNKMGNDNTNGGDVTSLSQRNV